VSELLYIPPSSPGDPIPEELAVLFLEAVAQVTPAFQKLREQVFPKCDPDKNHFPLDAWLEKWHLDFDRGEFAHLVHDWTIGVLRFWAAHSDARETLAVGCDMRRYLKWPKRHLASDTALLLPGWNPERETYKDWRVRVLEPHVRKHRKDREAELEECGATSYEPKKLLAFEWLALSVCCKLSDGKIANKYSSQKVTRDAVKQARRRLAERLHILP
jgi:hypothetical protein